MAFLGELDYWTRYDGHPKPLVRLAARCARCRVAIGSVPRDKVRLARARRRDGYRRTFVCPHCRSETRTRVDVGEALRLFGAGAVAMRRRPAPDALTEDDLQNLVQAAVRCEDLVRRALDDGLAPD
jgi:hypothetical protein